MELLLVAAVGCVSPAIVAGVLALVLWLNLLARDQRRRLASELGLTLERGALQGVVDGRAVRLAFEHRKRGRRRMQLFVLRIGIPEVPAGLRLRPPLHRHLSNPGPDRVLGDPRFDAAFRVQIEDGHLAWLDAETRRQLLSFAVDSVADGEMWFELLTLPTSAEVRARVRVADGMARRDPREALRRIAAADPSPQMRILALEVLTRDHAGDEVSLLVSDLARSADLPVVRAAATLLAGRARELTEVWSGLPPTDLHAMFGLLARRGDAEQVACALDGLSAPLPRPIWFVATAAAAARPSGAVRDAVERAADRLAQGDDVAFVADRALHALLSEASTETQPYVLRWVGRADAAVPDALRWLGAHGTVEAVPVLNALLADTWPLGETRRAAEAAKAAIQARAGGDHGGLAIASADARGALSEGASAQGALAEARRAPEG